MMIEICQKSCCTGCAACASVCNSRAITMDVDKNHLGHLFPMINNDLCIDCGACKRVCPQLNEITLNSPSKAFAAWSLDDNVHKNSTSGGLAYTLAYEVIKEWNGVVYACAADYGETLSIKHVRIEQLSDLWRIQGSKYVQSKIDSTLYKELTADLNHCRKVLFIGTPCQVAAARKFVKYNDENFYSVDIICHGVPSMKLLEDYLQTIRAQNINKISFRSSEGDIHSLTIELDNGNRIKKSVGQSTYFAAFLRSHSYRDSCYQCKYAQQKRPGDITLGDFWGLGKLKTENESTHWGISVMLQNTEKAKHLITLVEDKIFIEERRVEEAINGNRQLRYPSRKTIIYRLFAYLYPRLGYERSASICTLGDRLHYSVAVPIVSSLQSIFIK